MAFAIMESGSWVEVTGPVVIGQGEDALKYPAGWAEDASSTDRAEHGFVEIEEPQPLPAWLRQTGFSLTDVDGLPVRTLQSEPIDLAALKVQLVASVNAAAGAFRLRFITDIPGQQATYLAKEQEAKAWTAGANPTDFPYLSNEAAQTGSSISDVVATVLATAELWRGLDPVIEGRRRGACVAIAAADTGEDAYGAAQVDWNALLSA